MLRTAIIGFGGIARSHLNDIAFFRPDNPLRAADDPLVELVGCCDVMPAALERFRSETGVQAVYTDVEKMLDDLRPDYIHVATCADVRLEPVLAAAARGIHVLCEKPLARDPAECDEMIAACDAAGVQFVVSHQRRSSPAYWHMKKMLDKGIIGTVRYVTGGGKSRRGGQEIHNIGSHLNDAVGILLGDADWVFAYCSIDGRPCTKYDREPGDRGAGWVLGERIDLTTYYRSGVRADFRFNEDPGIFHWIAWGTEGRLAAFNNDVMINRAPEPFTGERWETVEIPDDAVTTASGYTMRAGWQEISRQVAVHNRVHMMREMFERMETGGEHTSSGRVGAVPIEIMQATFLSHLRGAPVKLPVDERVSPLADLG